MIAYLGLGSNLGNRRDEIARAVWGLGGLGRVAASSPLYETEPEGGARQPKYLNAVVRLETDLAAHSLLQGCLAIERAQGRVRPADATKAPRTIDIDLLLHGEAVIEEPGLCVPHPSLLLRPFVRIPLADVALPGLRHPVSGESLTRCAPNRAVRLLDQLVYSPAGGSS